MRETFAVLKHNQYILFTIIAGILTQFTPSSDTYPIYRFLVPKQKLGKTVISGEAILAFGRQISGTPVTFLYPFVGAVVKAVGSPKRMQVINYSIYTLVNVVKFFAGYKNWGALAVNILMDTITETLNPLNNYADHILYYEMFDYVEWKTGVRSEGITQAFQGVIDKMIKNNIDSFTGNAFQSWTGITQVDWNDPNAKVPARYAKWAWPLFTLAPVVDNLIMLIARASFHYEADKRDIIEAELKERRALAEKMKEELTAEPETV